ncbi:hypothetical protein LCGC14_1999670 [marine sediment metagenome]|uniref:Uncharacterized protein n=1 Tax=marine sediment metagenome TaxID=412755 RepID=A0A0F9I0N7_9ZZZZ
MNEKENKVIIFTDPPSKITNKIDISDVDFISLVDGDEV